MSLHESSRRAPADTGPTHSALPDLHEDAAPDGEELEEETDEHRPHRSDREVLDQLLEWVDDPNIARHIDQATLDRLGDLVVREFEIDEESRAEWRDDAKKALDFATQKGVPKQYPWPSASNVIFPLITQAALDFNARAYGSIVQGRGVVRGVVWGDDNGTPATQTGKEDGPPVVVNGQPVWKVPPGAKQKRADKIGEHMSYQLLEVMEYWEAQTDEMLMQLPIIGGAVRKTYRDAREDQNASELVSLMKLVWNLHAKSFEAAPRHTEIQEFYPHEVQEFERDETFLSIVYGAPTDPSADDDDAPVDMTDSQAPHQFLEQHRRFDLDGDGYDEPIIVTVHLQSARVVRIVARYDEDGIITADKGDELKRIEPVGSYTLFRFLPNPKGGSYPAGFGHLLKPLNEAINTSINQMIDAGHLQIAGGGFIGQGLSLHAGSNYFQIGEYKPVNARGGNIRDSVFPIPWPGPSAVLFQLLGFLVDAAQRTASIQQILTGDSEVANAPPGTVLALIEQGIKVYTAIHKRIYRALKQEFAKLYRLNRIYLTDDERYRVGDTWRTVTPEDYRLGGGVEPVADPTQVTDMQKITRAMFLREIAKDNPLVDQLEVTRRALLAGNIEQISALIPDKPPPPQPSPEQIDAQIKQQELQFEGQKIQLETAAMQSKVGLQRAQELQAYTLAMLQFQKARTEMTAPQIAWMEAQLNTMRLHIEALNTTVKAAQVDAHFRGHEVAREGHHLQHRAAMAGTADRAKEVADEPGPADNGPIVLGGGAVQQPPDPGNDGSGLSGMAPQPGNSGLPPIPGPPGDGTDAGT